MTQLIPFDSGTLPSHITAGAATQNLFAAALGGGFPVLSIKSKVFHIVRGEDRTLVTQPGDNESPASSVEVVIVDANPARSKVFYGKGYEEGSVEKPDCYSNDGIAPAQDAEAPQAKKCALCPHNQWGSKVTDSGKQAKACSDHMRLAIVPGGQLNDAMLLRVPATSLPALGQYGDILAKRGVAPHQVVTKVGFDYTVSHPALTFKVVGFTTPEMNAQILETKASPVVAQILGTAPVYDAPPANESFESKAEAPKEAEGKKTAAKRAARKEEPAAEPAEPTVATETAEVAKALADLDFDD